MRKISSCWVSAAIRGGNKHHHRYLLISAIELDESQLKVLFNLLLLLHTYMYSVSLTFGAFAVVAVCDVGVRLAGLFIQVTEAVVGLVVRATDRVIVIAAVRAASTRCLILPINDTVLR